MPGIHHFRKCLVFVRFPYSSGFRGSRPVGIQWETVPWGVCHYEAGCSRGGCPRCSASLHLESGAEECSIAFAALQVQMPEAEEGWRDSIGPCNVTRIATQPCEETVPRPAVAWSRACTPAPANIRKRTLGIATPGGVHYLPLPRQCSWFQCINTKQLCAPSDPSQPPPLPPPLKPHPHVRTPKSTHLVASVSTWRFFFGQHKTRKENLPSLAIGV